MRIPAGVYSSSDRLRFNLFSWETKIPATIPKNRITAKTIPKIAGSDNALLDDLDPEDGVDVDVGVEEPEPIVLAPADVVEAR